MESFELIGIYLKKCVQKGLKKCDYTISMDMSKDHIATLPKRGLKTRSYKMDMEKKDLKKLTKGQLIELSMNQRKNEEVESVKKPTQPP